MRLAILLLFVTACGCPSLEGAREVSAEFEAEARAACASVEGCDLEYVLSTPIFQAHVDAVRDVCDGAHGCFCHGAGCEGAIYIPDTQARIEGCCANTANCFMKPVETALHEYVHAAFRSTGRGTGDHPIEFWWALGEARQILLNSRVSPAPITAPAPSR